MLGYISAVLQFIRVHLVDANLDDLEDSYSQAPLQLCLSFVIS